ncbi:hypothetical protein [Moraxella nonliquefaciens]|uniref:Uncharacterized protein n=1 Tax=Moraxella nonliquefaciens TaxID=478 RepID=A0A7T3C189_MORNO|nr:hypothetical protein [Moraxella nonliquefaciens]QPT44784.1 hypothetical protein I6G26_01700 [Moraxella nonliquefaciens]QQC29805.1 hypothetical protein I6H63_00430 [Moraxella nonliquefaciens]
MTGCGTIGRVWLGGRGLLITTEQTNRHWQNKKTGFFHNDILGKLK